MSLLRRSAALALIGAFAVGCSSEGTPKEKEPEPSAEELYCEAFRDYYERSVEPDREDFEVIASMKEFASQASGLEVPESMSAEARAGLKTWIRLIEEVPADATEGEVAALGNDLSAEQVEQLDAYRLYSNAKCLSVSGS